MWSVFIFEFFTLKDPGAAVCCYYKGRNKRRRKFNKSIEVKLQKIMVYDKVLKFVKFPWKKKINKFKVKKYKKREKKKD